MKKVIEDLAAKHGVRTAYQGSTRVMFLKGPNAPEFKAAVRERYPTLGFDLIVMTKLQEDLLPIFEALLDKLTVDERIELQKHMRENQDWEKLLTDHEKKTAPKRKLDLDKPEEQTFVNENVNFDNVQEEPKQEPAKKVFPQKEVDAYLIENKVDRKIKGIFKPIAEKFGVTTDYISDRHRKLRAKGLIVEIEETVNA
jgi:hypothetical protein